MYSIGSTRLLHGSWETLVRSPFASPASARMISCEVRDV